MSNKDQLSINSNYVNDLNDLLDDPNIKTFFEKMSKGYYNKNVTDYKLNSLFNRFKDFEDEFNDIKEKIDIDKFAKEKLDITELESKLNRSVFPNLDLERLKELYDNPPIKLKSPAYNDSFIFDPIVVRKYIIAIMQMVFNKMDLLITYCGGEGTGKTTASTQDAYLCYYIMYEIKLITYDYTLKSVLSSTLKGVINSFNRYTHDPFRIFILDEGNELNRKNWGNPLVQMFVQKLRRERSHLRIVFINLPQLGELTTDLTLARVNFVFQMSMKPNTKTKLVDKGLCSFFIIPRTDNIYSYLNKAELSSAEIRDKLGSILDDKKKYYKLLPNTLAVCKFKRNGVWSFNERKYELMKKEANESFGNSTISLTKSEIYMLYKYFDIKKLGVKSGTKAYHILAHLKNKKIGATMKQNKEQFDSMDKVDDE